MSYKSWSPQEINKLQNLALSNNFSYKNIGEQLGRSKWACQAKASQLGIKNKFNETTGKKYQVNENFWEKPNEVNSYWAGFSAADANIQPRKNNHFSYRIELSHIDKEHLKKFIKDCQFSGNVLDYQRPKLNTMSSCVKINSDKWADDLKKNFGIIPSKTKIIMPPTALEKRLLDLWLIGYTDGDGCIHVDKTQRITIGYVSSNHLLIEWIADYFEKFGSKLRNQPIKIKKRENYSTFVLGGIKAAQFIHYVHSLDTYCLFRKWKNPKVQSCLEHYKSKWPNSFDKDIVKIII